MSSIHLSDKDAERFHSYVKRSVVEDCWPWLKGVFSHFPHGKFKAQGKTLKAHRVAYQLEFGELPDLLRHTCDNPKCCNPYHIIPGTQQDNMNDMVERRRSTYGEINPNSKLTEQQVLEIRESLISTRKLAKIYDVTPTTISYIKQRRSWSHI